MSRRIVSSPTLSALAARRWFMPPSISLQLIEYLAAALILRTLLPFEPEM
jgi:hypothetical protein